MRTCIATLLVSLFLLAAFAESKVETDQEAAVQETAREFGLALTHSELERLVPLLPRRGKVQLRLQHLGPEQGWYSAGQVLELLEEFLRVGSVGSFEVSPRCEGDGRSYTLVQGLAEVTDREGRELVIKLQLTIVPEDGRWILREIRETPL